MIPQGMYDPRRADELKFYLIDELNRTMRDRKNLEEDWVRWEEIYRARPLQDEKNFPFKGASNLVIPVAAADIETLYARLMGLLFEPPNLWSVEAARPEMVNLAAAAQEFLRWAQDNEIQPYRAVGNWLLELHKLGTGVMKQRYTRDMKKVYEWRELEQGNWQQQAIVMLNDHPSLHHVRLHDFYIPAGFPLVQQAPWVAERVPMTWMQFMNRVKAGIYTNAGQVGNWQSTQPLNNVQQQLDTISRYKASTNQQLSMYEFWLDFDIDGDGWDEALVCTVHLESQSYVRLDFNPFFNQEKPYSAGCFMRDVNSFYGIGLCEMLDHFQEEITAIHNQRIDNSTVMNSQMFAVRKDNNNIRQNEPVYPSKIWKLNDPSKDLVPISIGSGQTLGASIETEAATRAEAQRRTGVNDWIQANFQPSIGYGTAYTTQQMIMQATKRFGETLREVRIVLSESGTRILELYQQYNQRGKPFVALGQQDGSLVDVVLKFPLDLIRKGLRVNVTAISAETSKDAQIRTTTLVFEQLNQFYVNYMQMISYTLNPQMPEQIRAIAQTAADGSAVLMRRLLELYGQQDADRMLPNLEGGINAQQRQLADIAAILQSGQPQQGGAGVPQGPPQTPGMAVVPAQGAPGAFPVGMGGAPVAGGPGQYLQSPGPFGSVGQSVQRV